MATKGKKSQGVAALRESPMMAHLLDAIEAGRDVREPDELVRLLAAQPGEDEERARATVRQVEGKEYNPPRRERILEWQRQQEFPICPNPEDPEACNVYRELRFPEEVYESIGEFWEEK